MCMYVCRFEFMDTCVLVPGRPKGLRSPGTEVLGSYVTCQIKVLGLKLRLSTRAARALNHCIISPAPSRSFYRKDLMMPNLEAGEN